MELRVRTVLLLAAGAGRPVAAASTEELVVRLCGSTRATAAVLVARRAGNVPAHPRTSKDFSNPLDQTKASAAVACRTW